MFASIPVIHPVRTPFHWITSHPRTLPMRTTDYGFLRLLLCSNVLWKAVIWQGMAFFAWMLFYGLLYGSLLIVVSLFADMLGLPGGILREDLVSERNPSMERHRSSPYGVWAYTGAILLLIVCIGAISCLTTMEIRVTRSSLVVIQDPSRRRSRSARVYPLCDVEAGRGWCLGKWMGIILEVANRDTPVCFVLERSRAAAVIAHVNGHPSGRQHRQLP